MTTKQVSTPKEAAAAINNPASEWTARRALQRIGLTSAVKQKKNNIIREKCIGASQVFQSAQKLERR